MDTWFGICCAFGSRMWSRGLVYPLSVARTTWICMPDVCNAKGEWVEHGVECHEISNGIKI